MVSPEERLVRRQKAMRVLRKSARYARHGTMLDSMSEFRTVAQETMTKPQTQTPEPTDTGGDVPVFFRRMSRSLSISER